MALSKTKKSKLKKKKFVKKLILFKTKNTPARKASRLAALPKKVLVRIETIENELPFWRTRAFAFAVALFFGLQLCLASGWYFLYSQTILSFQISPLVVADANLRAGAPTKIEIKKAGISLPITPALITNGMWQTSDTTATHLATSARPAEGGNVVIYGHNLRNIFGNLPRVEVGDTMTVQTQDGKVFEYVVEEKTIVNPNQIEKVLPTSHEVLTVYTCTGFLDSKRLVITATPRRVSSL